MTQNNKIWIGFDLGGTKMLAAAFTNDFKCLAQELVKTHANEGAEAGLNRIVRLIQTVIKKAGLAPTDVSGIGVGSPGPMDLNKGIILDSPNLGWKNFPLKSHLEQTFGRPVVVLNDVDAGVYGEYRFGAGKNARCVLGVFPGTGVGGGCVYEGEIIRGKMHSCIEIGHWKVLPNGPRCGCGGQGCLEILASRLAVSAACAAAAHRGQAPHLLKLAGMDLSNIRGTTLAESIRAGDKAVEQIVKDAARWIGVAVANAVNLLAPDVVILGGGLVEAMPTLYVREVKAAANAHTMPSFANSFKVVTAKLGDNAGITGAAAWAQKKIG